MHLGDSLVVKFRLQDALGCSGMLEIVSNEPGFIRMHLGDSLVVEFMLQDAVGCCGMLQEEL